MAPLRPPLGQDLVALLPAGADAVVDVDVAQLRDWPPAQGLMALLPAPERARLERMVGPSLEGIEALALSLTELGSERPVSTVVLRGELEASRVAEALGPEGQGRHGDYREVPLIEWEDSAVAQLRPRLVVLGTRADVRRAIDLLRGEGESVREAAGDRALVAALGRAPTAKVGRPAVMLAALPTEALRERLRADGLPGADLQWLALSLAVGEGYDIGAVMGLRDAAEASALVASGTRGLTQLRGRALVRLLGLAPILEEVVLVAKGAEVHLANRVSARRLEGVLRRLAGAAALRPGAGSGSR